MTSQEGIIVVQVRDDYILSQGSSSGKAFKIYLGDENNRI